MLVGLLFVLNIIASDCHEVLGYIAYDFRIIPDKLPGLGAILSAAATRITEVHPHDDWLVLFVTFNQAVKDLWVPVKGLKGKIVGAW